MYCPDVFEKLQALEKICNGIAADVDLALQIQSYDRLKRASADWMKQVETIRYIVAILQTAAQEGTREPH